MRPKSLLTLTSALLALTLASCLHDLTRLTTSTISTHVSLSADVLLTVEQDAGSEAFVGDDRIVRFNVNQSCSPRLA